MPVLSSYATAVFSPYAGVVEDYELGWPSIAIEAELDGGDAATGAGLVLDDGAHETTLD